jgi:hypothetical protein
MRFLNPEGNLKCGISASDFRQIPLIRLQLNLLVMRKSLIIAIVFFCRLNAGAQSVSAEKVPAPVTQAFAKAHPGVHPKWEFEDGNYEAGFTQGGKVMSCVLDNKGTILETETDMKASDLPASIQEYVRTHYKGKKIAEASKIIAASGEVNYEARVAGKDLIFDANGKYLKEIKEAND